MTQVIDSYLDKEKKSITQLIGKNFDISNEDYTKYEFVWLPYRASFQGAEADEPFEMNASVTVLLTKPRSLILSTRKYRFTLAKGCGNTGTVRVYESESYSMEEIYYNKITSVSSYHNESTYQIVNEGCASKEGTLKINEDGFTIRAGENFTVLAADKFSGELAEARSFINKKISEVN